MRKGSIKNTVLKHPREITLRLPNENGPLINDEIINKRKEFPKRRPITTKLTVRTDALFMNKAIKDANCVTERAQRDEEATQQSSKKKHMIKLKTVTHFDPLEQINAATSNYQVGPNPFIEPRPSRDEISKPIARNAKVIFSKVNEGYLTERKLSKNEIIIPKLKYFNSDDNKDTKTIMKLSDIARVDMSPSENDHLISKNRIANGKTECDTREVQESTCIYKCKEPLQKSPPVNSLMGKALLRKISLSKQSAISKIRQLKDYIQEIKIHFTNEEGYHEFTSQLSKIEELCKGNAIDISV
jgi:hypothetical protein